MNLKKYKHLFNIHLVASISASALFHFAFILTALFLWTAPPNLERDQPIFKELQVHFKDAPKQQSGWTTSEKILAAIQEVEKNLTNEDREYFSKLPKLPTISYFSHMESEAFPRLQ